MGADLFSLAGKVALAAGATGGQGSVIARAMAAQGAKVIVSDPDASACETLATERSNDCDQVSLALAADLSQRAQAERLADAAVAACGGAFITGQTLVVDGGTHI